MSVDVVLGLRRRKMIYGSGTWSRSVTNWKPITFSAKNDPFIPKYLLYFGCTGGNNRK